MSKQSTNSVVTTLDDQKPAAATKALAPVTQVNGKNHDADLSGKRRLLTIFKDAGEGGKDAVFVSINGYAYHIPRGKPCNVPAEVVDLLNNAVTKHIAMGEHGIEETDVPRYNISVSDVPDAEPVAA